MKRLLSEIGPARRLGRGYPLLILGLLVVLLLASVSVARAGSVSPERGKELIYMLEQDCGSCHGLTLKGGLGPALLPEDLSDKDEEGLVDTILHGRPGTPMPPWTGQLSETEILWLVRQLKEGIKK